MAMSMTMTTTMTITMLPPTIEQIQTALTLPDFDGLIAQRKMSPRPRGTGKLTIPENARLSSVLALLYCHTEELHLIFTRRRDDLSTHAGQISFPGGKHDPPESLCDTALRETYEELGIPSQEIVVLGELTPLYIPPSGFKVHPFVGWYANGNSPRFTPNENEVAEIIQAPLDELFDPTIRHEESWQLRGYKVQVPFFDIQGHKVWGATAMMLSELLERLRLTLKTRP